MPTDLCHKADKLLNMAFQDEVANLQISDISVSLPSVLPSSLLEICGSAVVDIGYYAILVDL